MSAHSSKINSNRKSNLYVTHTLLAFWRLFNGKRDFEIYDQSGVTIRK
jgi:hypothetical protein